MPPSGTPGASFSRPVTTSRYSGSLSNSRPANANLSTLYDISDSDSDEPQEPPAPAVPASAQANQQQMDTLLELVATGTEGFDPETLAGIRGEFVDLLARIEALPDLRTRKTQLERLRSGLQDKVKKPGDFAHSILQQVEVRLKQLPVGNAPLYGSESIDAAVRKLMALRQVDEAGWKRVIAGVMMGAFAGDRVDLLEFVGRSLQNFAMLYGGPVASLRAMNGDALTAAAMLADTRMACHGLRGMQRFDPEKDPAQIRELCSGFFQAYDVPARYRLWLRLQTCTVLAQVAEATALPGLKATLLDVVQEAAPQLAPLQERMRTLVSWLDSDMFASEEIRAQISIEFGHLLEEADCLDAKTRAPLLAELEAALRRRNSALSRAVLDLVNARLDEIGTAALSDDPEYFNDGRSGPVRALSPAHHDLMIRFEDRLRACVSAMRFAAVSHHVEPDAVGEASRRLSAVMSTIRASQPHVRSALYHGLVLEMLLLEQQHPGICKRVDANAAPAAAVERMQFDERELAAVPALSVRIDRLLEDIARRRESDYRGRLQQKDCPELIAQIRESGGSFRRLLLAKLARGLNVQRFEHNDADMRDVLVQVLDSWFEPAWRNGTFEEIS